MHALPLIRLICIVTFVLFCGLCSKIAHAADPYPCQRANHAKLLDGMLDDWLEPVERLTSWNWRHTAEKKAIYGGEQDCSASMQFAWDTQHLYCAVTITDDFHIGNNDPLAGDALMLTLAPYSTPAPSNISAEFVISQSDGVAIAYKRNPHGDWIEDADLQVGMAVNILPAPDQPYPHEREKTTALSILETRYEIAIPWAHLHELTAESGNAFGVLLQIQDVDVKEVRGCLRWRGRQNVPLTPSGYGHVVLVENME